MKYIRYSLILLFTIISSQSFAQNLWDNKEALHFEGAFDLTNNNNINHLGANNLNDLLLGERHEVRENNTWVDRDSVEHYYDINENETRLKILFWNGTEWLPSSQRLFEYDESGLISKLTLQSFANMTWQNNSQIIYINENGLKVSEDISSYTNDNWVLVSRKVFEYDKNENLISELSQKFEGGLYINDKLLTYEYDERNNQISWLNQNWNGLEWINFRQAFRIYDDQNNVVENYNQTWLNDNWVNAWNYLFEYNEENLRTEIISQNWVDSSMVWKNIWLNRYEFNSLNNLEFAYQDDWEEDLSAWENDTKFIYKYDVSDNLKSIINERWQNDNWQLHSRSHYYYGMNTSTDSNVRLENTIKLFPNPTTGSFNITFDRRISKGKIKVINASGQIILENKISSNPTTISVDLNDQPPGVYYLILEANQLLQPTLLIKL